MTDSETEQEPRTLHESIFDFNPKDVCTECFLVRAKNGTCSCHPQ